MDVFREAWENQVRILTEAVDDITTIDDFLAVSGKFRNQSKYLVLYMIMLDYDKLLVSTLMLMLSPTFVFFLL